MRRTITDQLVRRAKAPMEGRLEISDKILPGFGLRITPLNSKTYFVTYRVKGSRQQHRLTLGDTHAKTLAEARSEAQAALAAAQSGVNPKLRRMADVQAHTAVDAQAEADQLATVARLFVERHVKPNLKSWRAIASMVEKKMIPAWGDRPIQSITRRDVVALVDFVGAKAPVMANRVGSVATKLFAWCVERGLMETSPATGMPRQFQEKSRSRVLTEAEIKAVWQAADALGYPGGSLTKLLLLTACRLREVACLTRAQIAGDAITLPETKSGRAHAIPITRQIKAVLVTMPKFPGEYLLTNAAGTRPMGAFSSVKEKLDGLSGVTDWTFHDLRRTCATGLAQLGIAPHVVEAALNHAGGEISGVAAIYNRYSYADEKRAALDQWGAEVMRIVRGGPRLKVVQA